MLFAKSKDFFLTCCVCGVDMTMQCFISEIIFQLLEPSISYLKIALCRVKNSLFCNLVSCNLQEDHKVCSEYPQFLCNGQSHIYVGHLCLQTCRSVGRQVINFLEFFKFFEFLKIFEISKFLKTQKIEDRPTDRQTDRHTGPTY